MSSVEGDDTLGGEAPENEAMSDQAQDGVDPVASPPVPVPDAEPEPSERTEGPLVIGLGASAGGLEALSSFFRAMPVDSGLSFVVITHQSANRASLLPTLLAKQTTMKVQEIATGMRLEPDQVYLSPPGRYVTLIRGRFHLADPAGLPGQLAINHFFRSLANDQKDRAVGVVLSGTGSDGTLGLREIKATLGVSIVQAEDDAGFTGMPHSAITGDSPDFIVPANDIPSCILEYVERVRTRLTARTPSAELEQAWEALRPIFALLRQRTGHDFSSYKVNTVQRRIERRMNLHRLETLGDYQKYLAAHPSESDRLFDELLIGVTSFFRDPSAFDSLARLLGEYLLTKSDAQPLRVWVAGCSTGEEAYSLAMLIREALDLQGRELHVQIFATDLDPKAIEVARAGIYPVGIAGDVSPQRLKRFFGRHDQGYQVRKELREMVVFATQNLVEDPPFTKLDLMSCRNLLIYLDANLQRRLFPIFHYVLRPHGMLLLGSSETVGAFANLFDPVDKKWRLYRRREVPGGTYIADIPATVSLEPLADGASAGPAPRRVDVGTGHLSEKMLLKELVPPTVLMQERGDIVHIHGRTGMFLEPAPGLQNRANIYSMAREGLHLELAASVRQAAREGGEVLRKSVQVKTNGHMSLVDLRVCKLLEPEPLRGLFRVSFERVRPLEAESEEERFEAGSDTHTRVVELEHELQYTKESHQSTIEELETANEELKSTNEELQSTNEELQSANEELETSKEELQSLNEELQTVNVELHSKVEELSRANDDMTNLMNATDIATLFLDNELNIKRYTHQAKRVIRLIESDVGRSIGDLVSRVHYDKLVEDAREVLRTLVFKEVEVQGKADNRWYLMRILPYRTTENMIDGLVVTFVEITRIKELQQSEQRLIRALAPSPVSVFGLDESMRFTWACNTVFGLESVAIVGKSFEETFGPPYAELQSFLHEAVRSETKRRARIELTVHGRNESFDVFVEPHSVADPTSGGATCVLVTGSRPV